MSFCQFLGKFVLFLFQHLVTLISNFPVPDCSNGNPPIVRHGPHPQAGNHAQRHCRQKLFVSALLNLQQ